MTLNATNGSANEGFGLFARITESLRVWLARMETRAQLERLSERELADIGMCRADIEDVVNHRA
ncbi:DUF1127 domain-containing protein [Paracoccus aurantiacus]|uniref:DUF1127 domain-containing protein n=2 Tax=Paracoccus aurantiacus TaxID=2599412 RepID=A0A5C6SAA5_9RHOB|nr:DUF1127 domain-containing protein [Paracoccus aurantiacus]